MKTTCARRKAVTAGMLMAAMMLVACHGRSVDTQQDAGEGSVSSQPPRDPIEPALIFVSPAELETNWGVDSAIDLGFHGVPERYSVLGKMPSDWAARLKRVLRFTEIDTETDLPYGLEKKLGRPEKIRVKPEKSIEAGKGYRVTMDLSKGGSPIPNVKVLDAYYLEVADRQISV